MFRSSHVVSHTGRNKILENVFFREGKKRPPRKLNKGMTDSANLNHRNNNPLWSFLYGLFMD